MESRDKNKNKNKKGEDGDIRYMGIRVWWEKKTKTNKQTKNIWMKERKRIRNDHLKILPQYFHNKF